MHYKLSWYKFMFEIVAYSVGIASINFQTSLDLSQEATVITCDSVLPTQQDVLLQIYASRGCPSGISGQYVYIYKSGLGSILLKEVIVRKATASGPSNVEGKWLLV